MTFKELTNRLRRGRIIPFFGQVADIGKWPFSRFKRRVKPPLHPSEGDLIVAEMEQRKVDLHNQRVRASQQKAADRRKIIAMGIAGAFLISPIASVPAIAAPTVFTSYAFNATGGSTPRTMPARLADQRNFLDFGADPTGNVDCSAALNAALAAAGSPNAGTIICPPGTYLFTEGANFDALGGNGTFVIEGCGNATSFVMNGDDFIIRKVLRNTGSAGGSRTIRNIKFSNTKLSLASQITTITNVVYSASISGGGIAGQPGVTVTLSAPHGYAVGQSRLMNTAGIVTSGSAVELNGLVGVYFNGALTFQFYCLTNPGSYVSGGSYAPRGGGVSQIAFYGGAIYDCDFSGYYAFYGAVDCTVKLYNCNALGSGQIGIGFSMGAEAAAFGFDVTGFAIGIKASPGPGLALAGGRIEVNTHGLDLTAASFVSLTGTTFESNFGDGVIFNGSSQISIAAVQIHGSTSANGFHFSGSANAVSISDSYSFGTFSGACITLDNGLPTSQGLRFRNVAVSNTGSGTNTANATGNVCPQMESCLNFNAGMFASTFANRPADAYCVRGDTWHFTDSAVAAGSSTAISGGGANGVIGRFDGTSTWYVVCRAG